MLRIHETILELIRDVAPIAEAIGRHDADLARQLRRAMSSVPLNVSEGAAQRGARRNSHYSIALGSARESVVGSANRGGLGLRARRAVRGDHGPIRQGDGHALRERRTAIKTSRGRRESSPVARRSRCEYASRAMSIGEHRRSSSSAINGAPFHCVRAPVPGWRGDCPG